MAKTNVIVLIGRTGNGKSSTGNTLLGKDTFHVVKGATTSVTKIICQSSFEYRKKNWTRYDVPGLFDSDDNDDVYDSVKFTFDTFQNFLKQIKSTGVHAFLLIFNISDRFRQEEKHVLKYYKTALGKDFIQNFGILVFTHGDVGGRENFKEWIEMNSNGFKKLYLECQGRACVVSNIGTQMREESKDSVMDMIVSLLNESPMPYTEDMFVRNGRQRAKLLVELKYKKIEIDFRTDFMKIQKKLTTLKSQWYNSQSDVRELFQDVSLLKQKILTEDRETKVLEGLWSEITEQEKIMKNYFSGCSLM